MFESIAFGTSLAYVIFAIELIFLLLATRYEKYALAFFSLVVVLFLIFSFQGVKDALSYVLHHPIHIIAFAFAYFFFGSIYTISPYIGKWWNFVFYVRECNRLEKKKWLASFPQKIDSLVEEIKSNLDILNALGNQPDRKSYYEKTLKEQQEFLEALQNSNGEITKELIPYWKQEEQSIFVKDFVLENSIKIVKPEPEQYKSRIIGWIAYWPLHLLFSLISDPFKAVAKFLYNTFYGILKSHSDSMWEKE